MSNIKLMLRLRNTHSYTLRELRNAKRQWDRSVEWRQGMGRTGCVRAALHHLAPLAEGVERRQNGRLQPCELGSRASLSRSPLGLTETPTMNVKWCYSKSCLTLPL